MNPTQIAATFDSLPLIWEFLVNEGKAYAKSHGTTVSDCNGMQPNKKVMAICQSLPDSHRLINENGIRYDGLGLAWVGHSIYGLQLLYEMKTLLNLGSPESDNFLHFQESMRNDHFVTALKEVTDSFGNERLATVDCITEEITEDQQKEMLGFLGSLSPSELDQIIKAKASKSKKRSRPIPALKVNQVLQLYWLPLVLWNKSTAEILAAIPTLASGQKAEDHERDCEKINRAIQRLGWRRRTPDKLS